MRVVTRMADRLLELIAPHTVARAVDCGYECCAYGRARYCCYYSGGGHSCGSCHIAVSYC
ncbi:hypothetical protein ACIBHX_34510 [Nonomuraea sp. NPDC050536]|uniref:hypothetical protein n=1 Tax=Nonomuraea sp. NPDC050536 TaxID=3364366 RepID=UPI0037C573C6